MIPPLPRHPRNSDAFEDERHLLGWMVARLSSPCRSDLQFENLSAELELILSTVAPLFRTQISYGRAVYRLTAHGLAEAAFPVTRAMLELWAETVYILEDSATAERAMANRIWTVLTLRSPPGVPVAELEESVQTLKREVPELFHLLEARFAKHRTRHHSGMGWGALIAHSCGEDAARLYSFLSWTTHAITAGIANVTYEEKLNVARRTFEQARPEELAVQDVCTFAARALYGTWAAFYATYGDLGSPRKG